MLNQSAIVLRYGHLSAQVLELDKLDDLVEYITHHEMVLAGLKVLLIQQSQIKHVVDLELDEARRRLNLLEHIESLPVSHIPSISDQVDQDIYAGERCHQVVRDGRLQRLQDLVIMRLLS